MRKKKTRLPLKKVKYIAYTTGLNFTIYIEIMIHVPCFGKEKGALENVFQHFIITILSTQLYKTSTMIR